MTWGMVGAAAVTAVAGGVEANQNSKKAEELMNQQMGLQQQNVNSVQQFQQGQQQTYGPLEQQLVQQASSDQPLFFGAMKGAVNQNFDQGQRNLQTQMAQRGMDGSGLAAGGATGMELGRSGALDTAFQQGLQSRLQLGQSVLSRYQPMLNQSMLSQAYQGQSGVAGQQGQMYNQAAQQGWNQVGSALGSAATGAMLGMGGNNIQGSVGMGLGGGSTSYDNSGAGMTGGASSYWNTPGNSYTPYGQSSGPMSGAGISSGGLVLGDTQGLVAGSNTPAADTISEFGGWGGIT